MPPDNFFAQVAIWGILGLIFVVGGVASIGGRLPMNPIIGIRIPSTMTSDAAWKAAHKSAGPYLILGGLCAFAGVVLVFTNPSLGVLALTLIPAAGVLVSVIIAAIVASRSAMRVRLE
jgi:uncharacterized membrane protein